MLNYRRVSKLLSLMLRHRSDEFGLSMDQYGFVPVAEVGEAVHDRHDDLGEEDGRNLVADPGQHRFESVDDRIRALYGHSFFIEMDGEPAEPPERLYLWCSAAEARRFRSGGVVPVDRSYVHLSLSRGAAEARSRRVDAPGVVEVRAREAPALSWPSPEAPVRCRSATSGTPRRHRQEAPSLPVTLFLVPPGASGAYHISTLLGPAPHLASRPGHVSPKKLPTRSS